jgi:hypothetical protein
MVKTIQYTAYVKARPDGTYYAGGGDMNSGYTYDIFEADQYDTYGECAEELDDGEYVLRVTIKFDLGLNTEITEDKNV